MTTKLIEAFPKRGGRFQIEPDASSGSYFWAAGWLFPITKDLLSRKDAPTLTRDEFARVLSAYETKQLLPTQVVLSVIVRDWPKSRSQIDQDFPGILYSLPDSFQKVSRKDHLADSIMTRVVLAPFANQPSNMTDLGRLRVQECERVVALQTELTKCGAKVIEEGDTLTVDRDLQRPPHGDVFRDSGIESARHKTPESRLREEDVPEFLPEAGGRAAARTGRGDLGGEGRPTHAPADG
jgi:3-phosphoshikimate 1-carboxyvinyltransferase